MHAISRLKVLSLLLSVCLVSDKIGTKKHLLQAFNIFNVCYFLFNKTIRIHLFVVYNKQMLVAWLLWLSFAVKGFYALWDTCVYYFTSF